MTNPATRSQVEQPIAQKIARSELPMGSAYAQQVAAAVRLIDGGATVPFIARYRKEATVALDDAQLRGALDDRLHYLREARGSARRHSRGRSASRASSAARSRRRSRPPTASLTPGTSTCRSGRKRRTKAEIAKEAGLAPHAQHLLTRPENEPQAAAAPFVDAGRNVADASAALDGARAILVERFGEDADLIGSLREQMWSVGRLVSKVRDGKGQSAPSSASGSISRKSSPECRPIARWRCFAPRRRRSSAIAIDPEAKPSAPAGPNAATNQYELRIMHRFGIADRGRPADKWLVETRALGVAHKNPTPPRHRSAGATRSAAEEEGRARVRRQPARPPPPTAPASARATMGLDPGYRTGVKVAVVDKTGKVVATAMQSIRTSRSMHENEAARESWSASPSNITSS